LAPAQLAEVAFDTMKVGSVALQTTISANASKTGPARLIASIIADDGAQPRSSTSDLEATRQLIALQEGLWSRTGGSMRCVIAAERDLRLNSSHRKAS
jgi:hypothetical protein